MLNYNFVIFNSYDNKHKIDKDGYYYICTQELENSQDIKVVTFPLDKKPSWVRFLFDIHNSEKIKKVFDLPGKSMWYPYYFDNVFNEKKPICFIVINRKIPIDYLRYLKRRYPMCKIVLFHRDLIKVAKRANINLPFNPVFDLEVTFDKGESKKYGLPYVSEFESKIPINVKQSMESDIFFAGKAKDRLPLLFEAYEIFKKAGLKCNYYLTGVPLELQKQLEGVTYADHFMPYKEMLFHTVNTRCVFEVNQSDCDGYTSRFLEAVIYGKRLITNNQFIKESKFYKSGNILVVDNISDIDASFVKKGEDFVDYGYNNEFSPFKMIEAIETELIKKYGR